MHLTIREAAGYLDVDESTVRRWIRRRGLPVHRVGERLRLNAIELWEWAAENGITVSRRLLDAARREPDTEPRVAQLLEAGGIHYDVPGRTKGEAFREIVARLPLPPHVDRGFLVTVLEAREALGSTAVGDGIAIPHVRNPIVLQVEQPFLTLCFLRHPVDFGALDGQAVDTLFTVISATVPGHLRTLARLALVLRDDGLRAQLQRRAPAAELLEHVDVLERRATGSFRVAPRRQ